MKYNFPNDAKFDSEYFLRLSIACRQNCGNLIKTANLIKKVSGLRHSMFCRYTASEELQKAIFCMLVHREYMKKEQISLIFAKHEAKIILYEKIFNVGSGLTIDNQEFILDGVPLKQLDLKRIIEENKEFGVQYMKKRNDCMYVRPGEKEIHSPSKEADFEQEETRMISEISTLNGLWEMLWKYEFKGKFSGLSCSRIITDGKPVYEISSTGGILVERKNYRPKWAEDVDEQVHSSNHTFYYDSELKKAT